MSIMGSVSTDGSTTEVFQPMSGAIRLAEFEKVNMAFEVQSRTSNLAVRAGIRYSDDGVTWDTAAGLGSVITSLGWTYLGFNTPSSSKTYVQFGSMVKNASAAQVEKGSIQLNLAFQG